MSNKTLLKIHVYYAVIEEKRFKKPKGEGKLVISVSIFNSANQSLGKQCEWKSNISTWKEWQDNVSWDQSCLIYVERERASKILFRLLEDNMELGLCSYPMTDLKDSEVSYKEELCLSPSGSLYVQVGILGTEGTLRGNSKQVQGKNPYRYSRNLNLTADKNTQGVGNVSFVKLSVNSFNTSSERKNDGSKSAQELENTILDLQKRVEAKDTEIVRLKDKLQVAQSQKNPEQERNKKMSESERITFLQLQQQYNDLQKKLKIKRSRYEELESVAKKFEADDIDIRMLLSQFDDGLEQRSMTGLKKTGKSVAVITDTPEGYASFLEQNDDLDLLPEVKLKLSKSDAIWISKFLAAGGLNHINSLLNKVESIKNPDFPLMIAEAQLTSCVRIMMNTQSALLLIVKEYRDVFSNFIKLSLLSKNSLVKAQMCMLLAGLCLYNNSTHNYVRGLVKYIGKSPRPYFTILRALKEERDKGLMTACISLINALLAGEIDLGARMRMRSLFLDSGILTTMEKLEKQFPNERGLLVQFDVFREFQNRDQEKLRDLRYIGNIDLHHTETLFNRVMLQTSALGLDRLVLTVLQHMLLVPVNLNAKEGFSFIERIARRVTSPYEAARIGNMSYEHMQREVFKLIQLDRNRPSDEDILALYIQSNNPSKASEQVVTAGPTIPNRGQGVALPGLTPGEKGPEVPSKKIPKPPDSWKKFKPDPKKAATAYKKIEQKSNTPSRLQNKNAKVAIFDTHFANNISILRAQFRKMSDTDIISKILDVRNRTFTTAQLEALLKCVPTEEFIIDMLLRYEGDIDDLREAERFSLTLLTIDRVGDLLQNLIFYDEFEGKASTIQHQIVIMKKACEEVLASNKLRSLISFVLGVGNFLNYGEQLGNAKGIQLSTLGKLAQLRAANNPRMNLLDFSLDYIEENIPELLDWYSELPTLEEAARYHPNLVKEEITHLNKGLEKILDHMENSVEEFRIGSYHDYYTLMERFLDIGIPLHEQLQSDWENFKPTMDSVLAIFPTDGVLQIVLSTLYQFAKKFRDIIEQRRRSQEEFEKFEKMGWLGNEVDSEIPQQEQQEQQEQQTKIPKKLGILDQLIEGVIRGDFGISEETVSQFEYYEPKKAPVKSQSNKGTDQIDALLHEIEDDLGFGASYAEDLGSFGGEDFTNLGNAENDIDSLFSADGDLAGFTIEQLLG